MSKNRDEEQASSEFYEKDELDTSEYETGEYETGKGLRPVSDDDMLNLLQWLQSNHPEVTRIEGLPQQRFSQLVGEYEASTGKRARGNWLLGQRYLQDGYSNELGYDRVRQRKKQLGL